MPELDMSVWTGRVDAADGPDALRWHQMVKPLAPGSPPGIVLIGFACDEGVRRNGGRVGAKDGPRAIRKALANLAWHQYLPVYDAGDVRCDDTDMEGAQSQLAKVVADAIQEGHRPLILGGGHETAWGTFQAFRPYLGEFDPGIGVINIDAHLDLRADEPGNSGTPFFQIANRCSQRGHQYRYLCLGASESSNTRALFDRARKLGAYVVSDSDLLPWRLNVAFEEIARFSESVEQIHLSIDLDALPAAIMPAVSAPAPRGVPLETVESLIACVMQTRKTAAVDVVEFNPHFDTDNRGARVAARLVWHVVRELTRPWDEGNGAPSDEPIPF